MNALILGGKSPRHKAWVREVGSALAELFDAVYPHDYLHWESGSESVDIGNELARISQAAESKVPYIIVAKSIGCVIAAMGVDNGMLSPHVCVFLGTPLSVIQAEFPEFQDLVAKLPRTIFIQNQNDPLGSAQDLGVFLDAHHPADWRFEILPGDTHDYVDHGFLTEKIKEEIAGGSS